MVSRAQVQKHVKAKPTHPYARVQPHTPGYTPLYLRTTPYARLQPLYTHLHPLTELGHLLSCEDALLACLLAALPRPPPLARLPPAALRLLLRGPLAPALCESAVGHSP